LSSIPAENLVEQFFVRLTETFAQNTVYDRIQGKSKQTQRSKHLNKQNTVYYLSLFTQLLLALMMQ